MKIKKSLFILLVTLLLTFSFAATALAHGHRQNVASYAACTVANCTITDNHLHNGCTYAGHYNGDGHTHHYNNNGHHRSGCHR